VPTQPVNGNSSIENYTEDDTSIATEPKPAKNRTTLRIPKLGELGKVKIEKNSESTKQEKIEIEEASSEVAIDISQLEVSVKDFASVLKEKGLKAEASILLKGFEIQENKMLFKLRNVLEEDLLNDIKQDLTQKLREEGNPYINIITLIEKDDSKKMLYTNKEKFDHILNKKPILKEFKDRFGLDTDF
jgi:hypothetical protein